MQETFTWEQARNMLLTGVCPSVEYADRQYINSFEALDGKLFRRRDSDGKLERGIPSFTHLQFKVRKR